jgi:predicted SnoaL-like aldol condensation-catalyzing enzyme
MSSPRIELHELKRTHWSEQDQVNAALVVDFVQTIMNDHNFDEIALRFKGKPYYQHNRSIGDGIEGVIKSLSSLIKNAPEFSYDVKHIYIDGDHVILHSHATLKYKHRGDETQGFNIMDTWRIENGELIEHWDAVQPMSLSMRMYSLVTGGSIRNGNGVF